MYMNYFIACYKTAASTHQQDVPCMGWIVKALEAWFTGGSLDLSTLPSKYLAAFQAQQEIGWNNWFRGRISKEFYCHFPKRKKKQAFLVIILNHTMLQCSELWRLRNEAVHGTTVAHHKSEQTRRIHAELDLIYKKREQYLSKDQDILLSSLEDHKKLPTTTIKNWLTLYKGYLMDSAKTAKKNALQGVKQITNYFSFK